MSYQEIIASKPKKIVLLGTPIINASRQECLEFANKINQISKITKVMFIQASDDPYGSFKLLIEKIGKYLYNNIGKIEIKRQDHVYPYSSVSEFIK